VSDEDRVDAADEGLRQWRGAVKAFAAPISLVASAVGRIDLDGEHKGTAFVVKEGLVLTNRHVVQQIAVQRGSGEWEFLGAPTITFDANPDTSRSRQFAIRSVAFAGPDAIDPGAWTRGWTSRSWSASVRRGRVPAPLPSKATPTRSSKGGRFTIGYAAEPRAGTCRTTCSSGCSVQVWREALRARRDRSESGQRAARTGETVFAHDATTLGGNSGSCVVDLGNDGSSPWGCTSRGFRSRPTTRTRTPGSARRSRISG
jgi:hypothetical protein